MRVLHAVVRLCRFSFLKFLSDLRMVAKYIGVAAITNAVFVTGFHLRFVNGIIMSPGLNITIILLLRRTFQGSVLWLTLSSELSMKLRHLISYKHKFYLVKSMI